MKNRHENSEDKENPACPTGWIIRNASQKPGPVLLIVALLLVALYVFGIL